MKDSITYFYETSTKIFAELIEKFYKDPSDIADFVKGIDDEIHKFGIMLVKETLEEIDDEIRRSGREPFRRCEQGVRDEHNTRAGIPGRFMGKAGGKEEGGIHIHRGRRGSRPSSIQGKKGRYQKERKIYLNSDGGGWIMMARRELHGLSHVLDEFHLEKCITKLTSHMKNSTDEAKKELRDAIRKGTEADFEDVTARLKECLPETRDADEFDRNVSYITNNWMAAKTRLCHSEGVVGSSMLELVRYQKRKKTLPKAAGAEGDIALTLADIRASEKTAVTDIEKYYDTWNGTLSLEKAKQYWMQYHMWLM